MSTLKASKASWSGEYFALLLCLGVTLVQLPARADDDTMRTHYPSSPSGSSGQTPTYTPAYAPPNGGGSQSPSTPQYAPNTPQYPPSTPSYGGSGGGGSFRGFGTAMRGILGGQGNHLPSAAPNPATMPFQGGQSAAQSEHQRVMENMRRAGYSNERIKALDGYTHQAEDPPGTTYRTIGGIRYRNDGVTPGQALNNIINNGTMNTPIHADYHQYQPGTYGYYRGTGGTKDYGQWLNGQR